MISFYVVMLAVAISFSMALFWFAIINYNTGFLRWKNNNVFNLAIGGIAAVGISGLLQFILLEDRYFLNLDFLNIDDLLDNSIFFYIASAALFEEFFKGIVVWWGISKMPVGKLKNGVIIGMVVGLFFAIAENGIYFATQIDVVSLGDIFNLVIARTIFSSIAHMAFSGIIGFFIVKESLSDNYFKKIFFILLGLFVVILIHTIFNLSVILGFSYWALFIIVLLGGIILSFIIRKQF